MLGWDGTDYYVMRTDAAGRHQVRGEDQLFSFKGVLAIRVTAVISGANGFIATPAVPVGEVWVVTTITAQDSTSATTNMEFRIDHDGTLIMIHAEWQAFVAWQGAVWSGHTYLDPGDYVRADFAGGLVGDNCLLYVTGYRMTLEA
ncbi:hypothetical protein KKE60_05240 [Patescibacteria group bacterium]|nr:hypothetical protein [Patescibacteria group bacterium]